MKPVVLWGPMGAGKTAVGAALAHELGCPFTDLDAEVERLAGRTVPEIFSVEGEVAFRRLELAALSGALELPSPQVVALGGGSLVDETSRRLVLERALVIGLFAPLSTLAERVRDGARRPLLAGATDLEARLAAVCTERRAAYSNAHHFVATEGRSISEVVAVIVRDLRSGIAPLTITTQGHHAYAVRSTPGEGAEATAEAVAHLEPSSTFLVTDENVAALHLPALTARLAARSVSASVHVLRPGETEKTMTTAIAIVDFLQAGSIDRGSVVIALGGGVVTDLAGFASSIVVRGVRWIAVPTTVLAMVDAAIGGKTGVNHGHAKNSVGTFHHPSAVLVDTRLCETESDENFLSGLAEAIKTALVSDADLFGFIETHVEDLASRDPSCVRAVIERSAFLKAAVVQEDPSERGRRAILNFGHTFGHAVESATSFSMYTHGQAVAIGMVAAARVGSALGITPADLPVRISNVLNRLRLPTAVSPDVRARSMDHLKADKKRVGNNVGFVALETTGKASVVELDVAELRRMFTSA